MADELDALPQRQGLGDYLDTLVARYETIDFITTDPISIPLGFDDPRDQEIAGLFAAILAWGRRDTLLRKLNDLLERMEYQPTRFVTAWSEARRAEALDGFGHRTFKPLDAVWLCRSLGVLLDRFGSLEEVFSRGMPSDATDVGPAIQHFSTSVMNAIPDTPARLGKHLPRPQSGSACKRLCMYLRWMVRPGPVDLGLWNSIKPSQLVLPLDVHSGRQARALGLLNRKANDWKAALLLTERCRLLSPEDPARYDYALFGPGANGHSLDPRFASYEASTER